MVTSRRAKNIIWLFMEGGPSAVDIFDPKPELTKRDGERIDINVFFGDPGPLMKSPFQFQQYGESGAWVCEKYTNVAKHVDDIAFIKSCFTESDNHVPAIYQINSGLPRPGFPTAGAWVTYGLGSENQDLPGYVVLGNTKGAKGGIHNWGNGFLPSTYQGTLFRPTGNPILNLERPADVSRSEQRAQLDLLAQLNQEHLDAHPGEADPCWPEFSPLNSPIGCRLKRPMLSTSLRRPRPHTSSTASTARKSKSFGSKCLMARRLIESGVRFVQVYSDGEWDAHNKLTENHTGHCAATDVPIDGLLTDLKEHGLWDSTLVIWGAGSAACRSPNGATAAILARTAFLPGWPVRASKA
ncbi:MAG: DUF1501 domain-containing protein [Planctomycetaceae bacterium]